MSFLNGVLTFTGLLIICSLPGPIVAAFTGTSEWRGAVMGSILTAMFMLVVDPANVVRRVSAKAPESPRDTDRVS